MNDGDLTLFDAMISPDALIAFFKVVMIDLVLAGDNAIVIGMAAAGLPRHLRGKAILVGIAAATVLRILFAIVAIQLLKFIGLVLVGGFLLLWVCWKMWRELRQSHDIPSCHNDDAQSNGETSSAAPHKTFAQAAIQIVIADISMSLDNVLAVAGAAREHPMVLIFGLILSIALMGLAASFIAKVLNNYRWIAYVGLAIIVYVSIDMILRGGMEVWPHVSNMIN